jgi:phosphoglycolate phosphatase-like HAD superfamily hydrolase
VQTIPLVVGFDLDMTLIDTRPGFAACLRALEEETGLSLPVEDLVGRLGPPLDLMLAPHVPDATTDDLAALVARFRRLYPTIAVGPTPAFDGAHESLAAVRRHGGRSLVVTGKFTPNALLHVEALDLDVDEVVGGVWGPGKGPALVEHGARLFVGDHVHDVEGAEAAGILCVGVTTGGCPADELTQAGAHVVLDSIADFPAWLDTHLATAA